MNKLKAKIINLNMSVNKEIVRFVIIAVVLIAGFVSAALLMKNYVILLFLIAVLVLFSYFYFSRYKTIEKKRRQENLTEFANLFTFFRIYLKNGFGVYTSLREITTFANPSLKELLEKLLQDIDLDKSITPFIEFSHSFDELIVEEMMISIYQMIDDGSDSNYLTQFELIFDKFSDILHHNEIVLKDKSLANLTSSAIIGSAYLIIIISVGVINLLGVMFNGV